MSLFSQIIDTIFPKDVSFLVETQANLGSSYFKKTELKYINQIWVATNYDQESIQNTIHRIKTGLEFSLVDQLFEAFWQQLLLSYQESLSLSEPQSIEFFEALFDPKIKTLITIVPPDPKRKLERGFALPQLFAQKLVERLNKKANGKKTFQLDLIFDKKPVRQQTGLDRTQRLQNLDGKITLSTQIPNSKLDLKSYLANYDAIFILDDISTTGSTLNECAKVIKNCNLKIYGLVVASNSA